MNGTETQAARFDNAVLLLPNALRGRARELGIRDRELAEELRLRVGAPMSVLLPHGERELGDEPVTRRDLELLVEIATGASVHSSQRELRHGYISCRGGCRVGLCGSVYLSGGEMAGYNAYSSAAIRIAREKRGIADGLLPRLWRDGRFCSTLVIAPPGGGKTTLLRELVRKLASPEDKGPGLRVALCDERGEIAALRDGKPQLDVGARTDVLDGCPKAEAVLTVLRSMNPQVIALDEITDPEDVRAVERARNCGVALLATVHAASVEDLGSRPLYRDMLSTGVFENIVSIRRVDGRREYTVHGGRLGS